ncbi:TRAP transporter large permease [Anoxybacterium hadale]|uniref:TRAP transporter large permease n=1 Tax=Anoxybacterium hadale TaxID=3408580 RepID=A0ACD1AHZ6_9FIRM|nr:TRAP transporter large permease [Clostridiales bacterium]
MLIAVVFAVLLIIGLPIAFVLGATGLTHLLILGNEAFYPVAIQRMFSGINSFSLMAIPFFVLAGELMNRGRVTDKLVDLARECIGHKRGGLAYTAVLVAMFLSAILGSANAVCAILCSVLVPEMVKDKYSPEFSTSLIASSAIIGPIIPPSVTFILYAVLAGTSVNALFMGGIVPGILLGIGYMVVIFLTARKENFPKYKEKLEPSKVVKAVVYALPALIIPLVIVGGILTGIFTPTESGAIACFVAFIAGMFIYKSLKWSDLPKVLLDTGILTSAIMLIIAMGNVLGWTLAIDQIPQLLSSAILAITDNQYIVLVLILFALLIIGMFMEAFASMVIFVPVFAPLALAVGINDVHFGIVFSLMISVALITPPVGMCLFVSSNITGVPLGKLSRSIVPFVVVSFIVVLLIAFIPKLVLFLPEMLL